MKIIYAVYGLKARVELLMHLYLVETLAWINFYRTLVIVYPCQSLTDDLLELMARPC